MRLSLKELKEKEKESRERWAKLTNGDSFDLFSPQNECMRDADTV